MAGRNFRELLEVQWDQKKFLCVGLDSDIEKIPASVRTEDVGATILAFNKAIVDATCDIAGLYKLNSAFYEAHGDGRFTALRETVRYIQEAAPELPVILDAKRADIGNTNAGYVESIFGYLGADAVTVHPYMGGESLQPFLDRADKGIFVLCRTSNPGAGEFQDLKTDGQELYKVVARHVVEKWNTAGNCGLVVGATYPEELSEVRSIAPKLPILIPGIGAQNGDLEQSVAAGKDTRGAGIIIAIARAIIFASAKEDFAEAAREKARVFDSAIRKML